MDIFARRVMRKVATHLDLVQGEEPVEFDAGALRPLAILPPPLPRDLSAHENGQVKLVATERALYLWVTSKSLPGGGSARLAWTDLVTVGPMKAEGKWKRWSIGGLTTGGLDFRIPLVGRPRPGMVAALDRLGPGRPEALPEADSH